MNEHQKIVEERRNQAKTLANEIDILENQIQELEIALEATRIDIEKTNEEILEQEKELNHQGEILNESLRLMYEEKETSFLETLLSSHSFSSVLDRMEYLSVVKGKIDATIIQIEKIKRELEEKKASLESLKLQKEVQRSALNSQRTAKDNLLAETKGEEAAYQQKLEAEKNKYAQVKSEMEEMERASKYQNGSYNGPPSPFGFSWPLSDHSRNCGCYPAYRGHTGLDIGGELGTPVFAAADGEITLVNNNFSNNYNTWSIGRLDYGNYVKISHAGNFQTLYAHLLNSGGLLNIYPGKQVRRGEQIGFLGNTGYSSGPHLHFEIRYNGDPKNPLPYLP